MHDDLDLVSGDSAVTPVAISGTSKRWCIDQRLRPARTPTTRNLGPPIGDTFQVLEGKIQAVPGQDFAAHLSLWVARQGARIALEAGVNYPMIRSRATRASCE